MTAKPLEQRLQELLDKQELMELINAYCNAADRHDNEKMRALYHPDALDDHGSFSQGSAMEFIDRLPQIQVPMLILQHHVTTVNLKLDGDYAEGEVYVIAFHKVRKDGAATPDAATPDVATPDAATSGAFDLLIGGRYFDKYEKRDGVWKFLHRSVVADWAHIHDPSRVDLEHPILAGSHFGRPGPTDPSYAFFSLFQRGTR